MRSNRGKGDLLSSFVPYNELFVQQVSTENFICMINDIIW